MHHLKSFTGQINKTILIVTMLLLGSISFSHAESHTEMQKPYHKEGKNASVEQQALEKVQEPMALNGSMMEGEEKAHAHPNLYKLGPGDKLRVVVFGEDSLSGTYKIDGSGMVSVPLLGGVDIGGLNIREAETLLIEALKDGFLKDPKVTVSVAETRPFYIMGEVRRPGSYNFIEGMNVLNAVALSGGFTYRANKKKIEILKSGAPDVKPEIVSGEHVVHPGDIILVKERFF